MIMIIKMDSRFQIPMYFFLRNLSYLDLCYSTVIAPKTLANFLTSEKKISYNGCATQFFFFALFVTTECFLLAVMAFDRFSAICSPLLYPVHMSQNVCIQLVTGSYICGCINSMVQTGFTFSLHFCGENRLDHFFCDVPALIKISCVDTFVNENVMFILSGLIIVSSTTIILVSYGYILSTVLKIPSTQGRSKTFSTCGSHIVAIIAKMHFLLLIAGILFAPPRSTASASNPISCFIIPRRFIIILAMKSEQKSNYSDITEFILLGFTAPPKFQVFLFLVFLMIYMVTVVGNVSMIMIIKMDSRLQTPMYFFLRNLSYLDFCYSTVIAPKTLANFLTSEKKISYNGCATQFFFFALFATTECFLLAVMAFDRFSAICSPLLYPVHMSQKVCIQLVTGSYICGCINSMVQTGFTFSLHFCGENRLDHFFCDVPALIKISCVDTFVNENVMFILSGLIIVSSTTIILVSYGYILSTVLKIPSTQGRSKTFSTCGSHIVAVSLFYGIVFFMYAQPGSISSPKQNKIVSVFYTLIIPMLNPLIYSLRN
ncbi:Olfactory receptor 12 [Microtus ochrogaster]|uniref:Olfactory receptor 12 n=1 Tax=Microtus ochrogaster TaxID=79684 RepID=A0A8J6G0A7_MICOH|nr:Olfactory receptor 12 [Microtus ochrogaster]